MARDRSVVVGVDGSGPSVAALFWAMRSATFEPAVIRAVTAWQVPVVPAWTPMAFEVDATDLERNAGRILDETITAAYEALEAAETGPRSTELDVRPRVVQGSPALVLLDEADGADLLVVGTRGHGAFTGMLLGSVSAHLTGRAPCPVVAVPHAADDDQGDSTGHER